MKKVLSLLLLAGLFMFGGCGGSGGSKESVENGNNVEIDDYDVKRDRIEEMLGKWNITVNLGSSKLNKELYFRLTTKTDDGDWAVGYAGDNFTDICIFDEEENAYIAGTVYYDEITGKETGDMEAYRFSKIINGNNISGVYIIGNDETEEYSDEYYFEGTRSSTFSATADNKKSIKKSLKGNEKIELKEDQKEKIRKGADLIESN